MYVKISIANKSTIIVFLFFLFSASSKAATLNCMANTEIGVSCFKITGTLSVYANLRPYLYDKKSKRIYGIALSSDDTDAKYLWPDNIQNIIDPDTKVTGNYSVCPINKKIPGRLQNVCIASASNLSIQTKNK